MVKKLFILFLLCSLFSKYVNAQNRQHKYSVGPEILISVGGELSSSYDFLMGVRGNYFLKKHEQFDIFLNGGVSTDFSNLDSRRIQSDLQIGSSWNDDKRLSFYASVGGIYIHESHSLLLITGRHDWQNSVYGITGNIGTNLKVYKSFNFQLFFKQTNMSYSSVGIGLNYSF